MAKNACEERVVVRLSQPLHVALELTAAQDGRPTAALIRQILIDWAAERVTSQWSAAA
jgi:hypothetical protein